MSSGRAAPAEERVDVEPMLSISEVARRVGVAERTVRRWIAAGLLDAFQPVPRGRVLIPADALDRFLAGSAS